MKSTCRSCQREYERDWRLRNVESERAKSLVWYCENTERAQRNHREWYRRNSVPSRTAARQWQINHPERVRINLARRRGTLLAAATAEFVCHAEATETDQVEPLIRGGVHMLCNLRPICSSFNYGNRDRWPSALVMERFAA